MPSRKRGVPDIATNATLTHSGLVSRVEVGRWPVKHWKRRLGSIVIFVCGAIAGAWLLQFHVAAPLIAASVIFAFALWPLMRGRHEDPATV